MTAHVKRRPTVLQVRCGARGHLLLTIHPVGGARFEVVRPARRAGGFARDEDSYLRHGTGVDDVGGFETLAPLRRLVAGAETGTVAGLLGDSPWLFCRCGAAKLTEALADRIGEAIAAWHCRGQNTTRPEVMRLGVT
ncbi:hypothetical protein [Mycobacterium canetti]|uniref:hypothetical protein n=1 Tax=Mycobacterium canetti TaxID=78331 RepID=UPI002D7A19AB|nr:hypothetical protein [Mycobacterium canetti]